MRAKEKHKIKLLKYLGDPEKEFPSRFQYTKILNISKNTLYKHFTPYDLSEIENEAVEIRKRSCGRQRTNVLAALYQRACGYSHPETKLNVVNNELVHTELIKVYPPDRAAAQEFFDRTEGKIQDKLELTGKDGKDLQPIINVSTTGNKHKSS